MKAKVKNAWENIPSTVTIEGLLVQRCSHSIYPVWDKPDNDGYSEVIQMIVTYYQRELYPTGEICKEYKKTYTLENLAETDIDDTHYMPALNVLDIFIASLGQNSIVNPILQTLANTTILPLNAPDNYPLHLNTRPILTR